MQLSRIYACTMYIFLGVKLKAIGFMLDIHPISIEELNNIILNLINLLNITHP